MTTATFTTDKTAVLDYIHTKVWGDDYEPASGAQPGTGGKYAPPRCGKTGLADDAVLRHCREDATGEEFCWYYDDGDLSNVDDDDSRADWYIIGKLAFYCGADTAQIARLFKGGEHYAHVADPAKRTERRKKLNAPRPGYKTLLLATIARVLADRPPERVWGQPEAGTTGKAKADGPEEKARSVLEKLFEDEERWWAESVLPYAVAERFHDASEDPYATVPVEKPEPHHETMHLRRERIRAWLQKEAYKAGVLLRDDAITKILKLWQAIAVFDGPERDVAQRIYQPDEETIWLDRCDRAHTALKVVADGWALVADPPIKFVRKPGNLALPIPEHDTGHGEEQPGARLERLLRPYVNVAPASASGTDHDWVLLVCWLLAAMRLRGPFPVLQLKGEQGAAKSTTGRVLRRLVDPHKIELEAAPGPLRDMSIAAEGTWVLAYDNLSSLTVRESNAICRMSTGGGYRTRALYTDRDEALFNHMRPVLLTGLTDVVDRKDLMDRTVTIALTRIPPERRKTERAFWKAFDADHPAILAALLDVLCLALKALPTVMPKKLPRMADFGQWAGAVEMAMGWKEGTFADALVTTEQEADSALMEDSPVADILLGMLNFARGRGVWADQARQVLFRGTMTELLVALRQEAVGNLSYVENLRELEHARPGWPKGPRGLTAKLADILDPLRKLGIEVTAPLAPSRRPRGKVARDYDIIDRRTEKEFAQQQEDSRTHRPATPRTGLDGM